MEVEQPKTINRQIEVFYMSYLTDKKVIVIGMGISGIAAAELALRQGGDVLLSEMKDTDRIRNEAKRLRKMGVTVEIGGHSEDITKEADIVVVSPGVDIRKLAFLKGSSVPLLSEIEFAYRFLNGKVIGVTGSNGKSTTVSLLGEIYRAAGLDYVVAGNIGNPLSAVCDIGTPERRVILELSSFQLELVNEFHAPIATVLNLTPDHLNRYVNEMDYYSAKMRIFNRHSETDTAVLNADDPTLVDLSKGLISHKIWVSRFASLPEGVFFERGEMVAAVGDFRDSIIREDEIGIPGPHNQWNAAAAAAIAISDAVPPKAIREALHTFKGIPHRIEFVAEIDNVLYYNDSKSTNIDSLRYALRSFPNRGIVLIAGGYDKGADFSSLRSELPANLRCVVLIGETADRLEHLFDRVTTLKRANTLSDAVKTANRCAEAGDVVLLSPGCASFDMFENFEDRGNQFKELVRRLIK